MRFNLYYFVVVFFIVSFGLSSSALAQKGVNPLAGFSDKEIQPLVDALDVKVSQFEANDCFIASNIFLKIFNEDNDYENAVAVGTLAAVWLRVVKQGLPKDAVGKKLEGPLSDVLSSDASKAKKDEVIEKTFLQCANLMKVERELLLDGQDRIKGGVDDHN